MNATTKRSWSRYPSPLGWLTLTSSGDGLDGMFFPGKAPRLDESDRRPEQFERVVGQFDEYFAGARREFELELDLSAGTPFQRAVWRELQAIPYGETISYGELARRIGRPDRARAVGAANGRNPVAIIVPCHRVIGADGKLTGYGGGLHRKQALLDCEAAVIRGASPAFRLGPSQLALI